jgi:hypothetical protein
MLLAPKRLKGRAGRDFRRHRPAVAQTILVPKRLKASAPASSPAPVAKPFLTPQRFKGDGETCIGRHLTEQLPSPFSHRGD